jgi:hypothetical protein
MGSPLWTARRIQNSNEPNNNFSPLFVVPGEVVLSLEQLIWRKDNMNTGLKNKLLILAATAGLSALTGCGGEEAPAAEEGATEATSGDEAAPAAEEAPAEGAPAEGAAPEAAGGEGSCGEGSCS